MLPLPASADRILAATLQHYNAGCFPEAEQASRALLALVPQHPAAHQLLVMLALNRQDLAISRAKRGRGTSQFL
ncbi:hypothetical protein [Herbaspirillum rubrisubalbicans]|uniref:hypothetical protein n=1 Tax=Herbaspirillum rubrisubalbicans TaxID=80842 RepID=UPI0021ACA9A2|nr:hypothetical protein [Herbaspirillum rubrisubalbicans]